MLVTMAGLHFSPDFQAIQVVPGGFIFRAT